MNISKIIDYSIPVLFFSLVGGLTYFVDGTSLSSSLKTIIVVTPLIGLAILLEQIRPEFKNTPYFDQSPKIDFFHYLFNYNGNILISTMLASILGEYCYQNFPMNIWPNHWNLFIQVIFLFTMTEFISYWQHRLYHDVPALWKAHAVHHNGNKLNIIRMVRFHFGDFFLGTFFTAFIMRALGGNDTVYLWYATVGVLAGTIQHSNIKMRTPTWLDYLICTPAVHRHHHSNKRSENDSNYAAYLMIFDHLFGSFQKPHPRAPEVYGIENETLPNNFIGQTLYPFKSQKNS